MNIATNLSGRLRNTPLNQSNGLMPLYEAVVNSIHGIEEAGLDALGGRIRVTIERNPALFDTTEDRRTHRHRADIIAFKITDNGVGFDDTNYESFMTLDSEHKVAKGGRGIGRLLWLKAFARVQVVSRFFDNGGTLRERSFEFTAARGVTGGEATRLPSEQNRQTQVRLVGFQEPFRSAALKTPDAIATALLEHCLWYFLRAGGCPSIELEDDGELIRLNDLFDIEMQASVQRGTTSVGGRPFELMHVKLRSLSDGRHLIAYCANNRLVEEERLAGKVPGLHGTLSDDKGPFTYMCYVSSPLLDERVRPERSSFDIPQEAGALFADEVVSRADIRKAVVDEAAAFLDAYLENARTRAREKVQAFVAEKAPRYRPILSRLGAAAYNVDPDINDRELELTLHRHLAELERQLLAEGHDLLAPRLDESITNYSARIADYMAKVEAVKMSDLAGYVAHRRVVIELLEAAIQRQENGRYVREDLIHTLIMPMRTESNEVLLDHCNLWLVDERLAFHDYLASDKAIVSMPITDATDRKEPDLLALRAVYDNPMLVSEKPQPPLPRSSWSS